MGSEKLRAKGGSRDRRSKKSGSRSRDRRSKKSGSRSRDHRSKKSGSRSRDRRSKKSGSRSRDRSSKKSGSRRKSGSRSRDRKKGRRKSPSKKRRSGSRDRRSRDKKKSRSGRKKSRSRDRRGGAGKFGASAASTELPADPASTVAEQPASAPKSGAVPDWLADLMGGAPEAPIASSEPLQIPGALASVITNDCAAIRSVMAQTGATVSIRGDCMHLGYSLAFFTGAAQSVAQAREMVQTQIGLSERTTITKEIEMSAELLAEGHVDAVLAQLQQRGTVVPIIIKHTDPTKNLVKIVLGPGPVAYVSTAEALMRKKIDGWLTDGGRQLCGQWRKGNCTFGANCKFRHGLELSSRKAAVPQASQATPALESPPPPPPAPPPIDDLPSTSQRTSATSGML